MKAKDLADILRGIAEQLDYQEEQIQRYKGVIKRLREQNNQLEAAIRLLTGATKVF